MFSNNDFQGCSLLLTLQQGHSALPFSRQPSTAFETSFEFPGWCNTFNHTKAENGLLHKIATKILNCLWITFGLLRLDAYLSHGLNPFYPNFVFLDQKIIIECSYWLPIFNSVIQGHQIWFRMSCANFQSWISWEESIVSNIFLYEKSTLVIQHFKFAQVQMICSENHDGKKAQCAHCPLHSICWCFSIANHMLCYIWTFWF